MWIRFKQWRRNFQHTKRRPANISIKPKRIPRRKQRSPKKTKRLHRKLSGRRNQLSSIIIADQKQFRNRRFAQLQPRQPSQTSNRNRAATRGLIRIPNCQNPHILRVGLEWRQNDPKYKHKRANLHHKPVPIPA